MWTQSPAASDQLSSSDTIEQPSAATQPAPTATEAIDLYFSCASTTHHKNILLMVDAHTSYQVPATSGTPCTSTARWRIARRTGKISSTRCFAKLGCTPTPHRPSLQDGNGKHQQKRKRRGCTDTAPLPSVNPSKKTDVICKTACAVHSTNEHIYSASKCVQHCMQGACDAKNW